MIQSLTFQERSWYCAIKVKRCIAVLDWWQRSHFEHVKFIFYTQNAYNTYQIGTLEHFLAGVKCKALQVTWSEEVQMQVRQGPSTKLSNNQLFYQVEVDWTCATKPTLPPTLILKTMKKESKLAKITKNVTKNVPFFVPFLFFCFFFGYFMK